MTENLAALRERRHFQLPTTTVISMYRDAAAKKNVAHSLDFDLVCVGENPEQASSNLMLAVKTYIEFGLSKGWSDEIYFPAPQEFWDTLTPDTPLTVGPTIFIDDRSLRVIQAQTPEPIAA